MTLEKYIDLIENMPYLEQAFETKESSWQRACKSNTYFNHFCKYRFLQSPILKISRSDVFEAAKNDKKEGVLLVILWGYPRNMRGNHFLRILDSLDRINDLIDYKKELTKDEFNRMANSLKGLSIGLSTLSKILYFFKMTIDGYQCLILDKRIVEIMQGGIFSEFKTLQKINEYNRIFLYIEYLIEMRKTAYYFKVKADKLEYFLFHFGKNIKSV